VTFTPGEGQLSIGLGGHEWVDAAISGAIGLVAVPPVLLGTAYGIWKENQLDKQVWQVIDERASRSRPVRCLLTHPHPRLPRRGSSRYAYRFCGDWHSAPSRPCRRASAAWPGVQAAS
jgi:hypothetical protein